MEMEPTTREMASAEDNKNIHPFKVNVPQAQLDDLYARLDRTLWADELPGSGTDYGVPVARVQHLLAHWRKTFDWRGFEARLNSYPQFTTEIDGQNVHFLHVRSGKPDAIGLILTHGWPGSIVEYLDVIEPLVAAGYDVVVPSTPGFGFSGPTKERGWDQYRVARAWVELMARLGYRRYGAVGNDGGSIISPEVGRLDPAHVIGVHVTQLFSFPTGDPTEFADLTPEEEAAIEHLNWFWQNMGPSTSCSPSPRRRWLTPWLTHLQAFSAGTASSWAMIWMTISLWLTSRSTGLRGPWLRPSVSTTRWPRRRNTRKDQPGCLSPWPPAAGTFSRSCASPSGTTAILPRGLSTLSTATTQPTSRRRPCLKTSTPFTARWLYRPQNSGPSGVRGPPTGSPPALT
ncbi:epoxide hydrolase family protein [Arthrobacter sp. SA17]